VRPLTQKPGNRCAEFSILFRIFSQSGEKGVIIFRGISLDDVVKSRVPGAADSTSGPLDDPLAEGHCFSRLTHERKVVSVGRGSRDARSLLLVKGKKCQGPQAIRPPDICHTCGPTSGIARFTGHIILTLVTA